MLHGIFSRVFFLRMTRRVGIAFKEKQFTGAISLKRDEGQNAVCVCVCVYIENISLLAKREKGGTLGGMRALIQ